MCVRTFARAEAGDCIALRGPWVSAHPDVILKMGVKEVLHRTGHPGWGTDTHLYPNPAAFQSEFPSGLNRQGHDVLKQNRAMVVRGLSSRFRHRAVIPYWFGSCMHAGERGGRDIAR